MYLPTQYFYLFYFYLWSIYQFPTGYWRREQMGSVQEIYSILWASRALVLVFVERDISNVKQRAIESM